MENNNHYNPQHSEKYTSIRYSYGVHVKKKGGTKIMNISIVQHKRNVRVLVQKAPNLLLFVTHFSILRGYCNDTLTITLNSKTIAM